VTTPAGQRWTRIQRRGQQFSPALSPAYRLIEESENYFIAEYCGAWIVLSKADYELTPNEATE
jgi:hypothetical protein